jgi:uncharacterized phiE125 gp8 family phage protein
MKSMLRRMQVKMELTLKTAPKKQPITLEEVKAMVGLETEQEQFDGLLRGLITAAIESFETETNMRLMEQSWLQYFEDWPLEYDYLELTYSPLMSVTAIKYTTSAGATPTWASANYTVNTASKPGQVFLGYNLDWPTATLTPASNAIEVEFICGYENADNVPYDIRNTLKLLTEWWFANRGEAQGKMPSYIMKAIQKHKIYSL